MLLEIAVGDALGAGYEFNDPAIELHSANLLHGYVQHAKHTGIKPGMYTDDTQMSIGTAEAIISREPWVPAILVRHWLAAFQRDPRDGYARRFQEFLEAHHTVEQFIANIRPESDRSGAAMRAGPIGLITQPDRVIEMATIQAEITHRTKGGVDSAIAAALMAWFCHNNSDETKQNLPAMLTARVPGYAWDQPWAGRVGVTGLECVAAALTAVVAHDSLTAILDCCVRFGGDVDTVASIAMAAASGSREIEQNLPGHLVEGLENGERRVRAGLSCEARQETTRSRRNALMPIHANLIQAHTIGSCRVDGSIWATLRWRWRYWRVLGCGLSSVRDEESWSSPQAQGAIKLHDCESTLHWSLQGSRTGVALGTE